jgi:3',5'-cyclic AMP phosphodiesterase CpdA
MCEEAFQTVTASPGSVEADASVPDNQAHFAPASTHSPVGQPDMPRPITLLHVSDIRFGRNHCFGSLALSSDDTFDTLLARLRDDLHSLEREHKLRPDMLVLSGDLAERGFPTEFDNVLQFVEGLTEQLQLPRNQVVLIPGNHDINHKACEAYFNHCEANEGEPKAPFWPKWHHYVQFFDRFYRDYPDITFTENKPWTMFPMPEIKLVVAGLNSTIRESHRDTDHFGYLSEAQLRWFADKLAPYKQEGWFSIAVLHHNIRHGPVADDENLRDADALQRVLGPAINLILHGHTYDGKLDWLPPKIPILATGSAAVIQQVGPEEISNQYQIVQIWSNRFKRWARTYGSTNKRWGGDLRASKEGDTWWDEREKVPFDRVEATFPQLTQSSELGIGAKNSTTLRLSDHIQTATSVLSEHELWIAYENTATARRPCEGATIDNVD